MAKIINLTESDIRRIVERVINEKTIPGKVVSVKDKNVTGVPYGGEGVYSGKGYYNTKGQFILHGYGKMKFVDNETYEGNWKNGYPDGYGKYKWDNGSSYRGNWKEGHLEGYGVYTNTHNIEFAGNFEINALNGEVGTDELNKIKTKPKTPNQTPKTPNQTPKTTTKPKKKCNFVSMPFKEENFCKLPTDTKWIYIKTDEGKWYTSKQIDKKTWCELTPQKFQKAIDILEPACVKSQVVAQSQIDNGTETLV